MRVALLEDDKEQSAVVARWLEKAGHTCAVFADGKSFMRNLTRESYDLLMLDWGIPDVPGDQVLDWIRKNVATPVPIMFITARSDEKDIVSALERGADDYLVKPVRQMEVLARLHALERRARNEFSAKEILDFEPFVIKLGERKLYRDGVEIDLTHKEFDLAVFLFRHMGQLLSRGHILESVWGRNPDINTRTVDTHVSRIRAKLGLSPESALRLTSVYFYGYRLEKATVEHVS
jgi:two-component system, OmpR family, response regulator RegX3